MARVTKTWMAGLGKRDVNIRLKWQWAQGKDKM
jgi:hypothetical protein